ncbi:hypothetical protein DID88_005688 [Monilinia fructigena]|uniref:CCHC-type domain-containing protein n=1 Tax=Monilinia fructigena TaxID=38457 RepID=A0A395J0H6_9HELO|nr:hypothetical protein DID88_005688 [Monilinia fructigena]
MVGTRATPFPRQRINSIVNASQNPLQDFTRDDNSSHRESFEQEPSVDLPVQPQLQALQDQINRMEKAFERVIQERQKPFIQENESLNALPATIPQQIGAARTIISPQKSPKLPKLSRYVGGSINEANGFFYQADIMFRSDQGYYFSQDNQKIDHIIQYFEKQPLAKDFKEYMLNAIMDKGNRQRLATQRIIQAKQRSHQSVLDFVLYLDTLEENIGEESDSLRRVRLLAGLTPSISKRISESIQQPTSRNDLIAQAIRLENVDKMYKLSEDNELSRGRKKNQGKNPQTQGTTVKAERSRSPAKTNNNHGKTQTYRHQDSDKEICYKCQQLGHKIPDCNNNVVCRWCSGAHWSRECNDPAKKPKKD